jgi:hypothetical protein
LTLFVTLFCRSWLLSSSCHVAHNEKIMTHWIRHVLGLQ